MIDLSKVQSKANKTKSAKTEKLSIPASPELVDSFAEAKESYASAEGAFEVAKQQLLAEVTLPWFKTIADLAKANQEVPSSGVLLGKSKVCRLTMTKRYPVIETAPSGLEQHFRQAFTFKIDGSKLPPATAQEFVNRLTELLPLAGEAVDIKIGVTPTPSFHTERAKLLTPDGNIEFQKICPAVIYVA
jgi:hypothetical protein